MFSQKNDQCKGPWPGHCEHICIRRAVFVEDLEGKPVRELSGV